MLRVLPPIKKTLQPYSLHDSFERGLKMHNIAIQRCTTSSRFMLFILL